MSILYIRTDAVCVEDVELYDRVVMLLYTRMQRRNLCEYLGSLEFLAEDRQQTFFKIDVDIQLPPVEMKLANWFMVSVTMKSEAKQPFGLFINFFCKLYPHKLNVGCFDDRKGIYLGSGNLRGGTISKRDLEVYRKLSLYCGETQLKVLQLSQEYRAQERIVNVKEPISKEQHADVLNVIVELAERFNVLGGHWLLFFQNLPKSKYEQAFDYMLYSFCQSEIVKHCNRFNAKISRDNLIISFGNEVTRSASDPTIMLRSGRATGVEARREHVLSDKDDPTVFAVRLALDRIYRPHILGNLTMKYKPEIISNCCIQRKSNVRPTVYMRSYAKRYYAWLKHERAQEWSRAIRREQHEEEPSPPPHKFADNPRRHPFAIRYSTTDNNSGSTYSSGPGLPRRPLTSYPQRQPASGSDPSDAYHRDQRVRK